MLQLVLLLCLFNRTQISVLITLILWKAHVDPIMKMNLCLLCVTIKTPLLVEHFHSIWKSFAYIYLRI